MPIANELEALEAEGEYEALRAELKPPSLPTPILCVLYSALFGLLAGAIPPHIGRAR